MEGAVVVDQVEVFERMSAVRSFVRRGVVTLDTNGDVALVLDDADGDPAWLGDLLAHGVGHRDPRLGRVLPSARQAFLTALVEHFGETTYFRTRRTTFPAPPDAVSTERREAIVGLSELVRQARDLAAKAMPIDASLAAEAEAHARKIESLRDKLDTDPSAQPTRPSPIDPATDT